jgi:hypothetical protein
MTSSKPPLVLLHPFLVSGVRERNVTANLVAGFRGGVTLADKCRSHQSCHGTPTPS